MQDRAPSKPNRYAVYDDAHNFIRYEYHERADEPTQVGSALNKANLLPDDVAVALGLDPADDPQVKDGFDRLSSAVNPLQYVWNKFQRNEDISYGGIAQVALGVPTNTGSEFRLSMQAADTITVSDDNTINLLNPQEVIIRRELYSQNFIDGTEKALDNKFFIVNGKVYKGDVSDITLANIGNGNQFAKNASLVTASVTFDYLQEVASYVSDDYPQDGYKDGFKYVYTGRPEYIGTKIETGSYTGTGTSGSANPNSLTFDFAPRLVLIQGYINSSVHSGVFIYDNAYAVYYNAGSSLSGNLYIHSSWSGNTLSWYGEYQSNPNVTYQLNMSDVVYKYVVIG